MNWNETRQFLAPCFPEHIATEMDLLLPGELREIRIRAERPTVFVTATHTAFLPWQPSQRELTALVEALSEHSLYARTDETRQGFLTLHGGHRLGLCGHVCNTDFRSVLSDIGSVCIRIAAEWPGSADVLLPWLKQIPSILVIGAPGAGKTTLLRDIARQAATILKSVCVAIVDERSELAACVNGVPQLDVGSHTDVLDGLPKSAALPWLVRSMAPRIIITDELAGDDDAAAVLDATACGVAVCASVHGTSLQDAATRPALAKLMSRRVFDLYVVLAPEGGCRITALYDRTGNPLELP